MVAPTRLVVLQRASRPLEGVCARLASWGCGLHHCASRSETLAALTQGGADIVMIDAAVQDGMSLVPELKAHAATRYLPVIAAATEDPAGVAAHALALGADDIFILPLEDTELFARIRALSRLAVMEVELRRREAVQAGFGVRPSHEAPAVPAIDRIGILLIGPAGGEQVQVMTALGGAASAAYAETAEGALERLRRDDLDVAIVTGGRDHHEVQSLAAAIRGDGVLFDLPLLLVAAADSFADRTLPFRWGLSDVLFQPFHPEVLRLRVHCWVRQQRLRRRLRGDVEGGALPPTTDRLTHLYAHGFLHAYVDHLIAQSQRLGTPLSVISFAIAQMRRVNQACGYAAGDRALAQLGLLLARTSRAEDLPARLGDDRFCLVLNGVPGREARGTAERIATLLTETPLALGQDQAVRLALRTGVAELDHGDDAAALIARAFDRVQLFGLRRAS